MFRNAIRPSLAVVLASGACLAQPAGVPAPAAPPATAPDAERPRIEVVFVLDTTGSMSGLIEAAKAKIWSIANAIVTTEPKPVVRFGLVGYRDVGDEYVTKRVALTDDLDAVYAGLMGFEANGGGDTPESVNQALHEGVSEFAWSTDPRTLRLLYLVGDAPPHMDYTQDIKYAETCAKAAKAGIIVNTIQCGSIEETGPIWREIALKAEGEYLALAGDGGETVVIATPFDAELGELDRALDATLIPYGSAEAQLGLMAKIEDSKELADAAPASAAADRAEYRCGAAGITTLGGRQELVQDCRDKKVDLATLKHEELPDSMRAMSPAERAAYVEAQGTARDEIRGKMSGLAEKRQAFIREKLEAAAASGASAFDALVKKTIREQAARKGIVYKD